MAAAHRAARLPPRDPPAQQADPRGRPAHRRGRAPGPLRRRRRHPRRTQRGAAPPRRAHPDPRRHHAHGPRRAPRQPPAAPRHARHARSVPAVTGLQKADLLITLGARFDDRVTGQLSTFAPDAKVIHADIDPAEISKNRRADVPIVGDCKAVITDLIEAIDADIDAGRGGDYAQWRERIAGWKATFPVGYTAPEGGTLAPQYVIERLSAIAGPEAIYVAGVGQHQMWAAQFVQYERPNAWLNSGGLGTMGYAVPAAMGAQVGEPERTVWAIDGDGCFQMTNQELATCVINNIPIKVAIINNSSLGMVRQWQTLFYNERYSNTDLHTSVGTRVPDFVKLADAYGCVGLRCETPEDVDDDDPAGDGDHRPPGRRRLRRAPRRDGVADGARRRQQRRHPGRPRHRAPVGPRGAEAIEQLMPTRDTPCPSSSRTSPASSPGSPRLFSRRGFNIDSLAVGETEHPDISRMTVVVDVEDLPLEQVTKQLNKLVEVLKVVELEPGLGGPAPGHAHQGPRRRGHPQPGPRDRPDVPRQGRRRRHRRR